MHQPLRHAIDALLAGGVIAYPTEGVYGLGCLPDETGALLRLLDIKKRDAAKGLILLAANPGQLSGWVDPAALDKLPAPEPGRPVTWLARRGPRATRLLTGVHETVAVRIAGNPVAHALCTGVGSAVTSTSANRSGRPVAANPYLLRRQFSHLVDFILPGACGPARGPSEIRDLETGRLIRPPAA